MPNPSPNPNPNPNPTQVKMYLLKHLPIYKFTDGSTDGDLVSSIYFDNPARTSPSPNPKPLTPLPTPNPNPTS